MSKFDKEFYAKEYASSWHLHNFALAPFYDSAQAYELKCISKKAIRKAIEAGEDPWDLEFEPFDYNVEYLDSTGYWVAIEEDEVLETLEDDDDYVLIVEVIDDHGEREAWTIEANAYDPERKLIFFDTNKFKGTTEIKEYLIDWVKDEIEDEKYEAEEAAKNEEAEHQ